MRVRILGESVIALKDREYTPQAPYFFALLLRLSADAGRFFARDALVELLFPSSQSSTAAMHSVRQLLYQAARRGARLEKRGDSVCLSKASVSVDIDDLFHDYSNIRGDGRPNLSILPGYAPNISGRFAEWLDSFRDYNRARLRHILLDAIAFSKIRAEWATVEALSLECLRVDPLNEQATLALAEALARSGSKSRALSLLDNYKREVSAHGSELSLPPTLLRRRIDGTRSSPPAFQGPLLERGEELSSLNASLQEAHAGRPVCTLIHGEAGIGKTRLLEEFHTSLVLAGKCSVVFVRRPMVEPYRPYSFIERLVPLLLTMPGAAGRAPQLATFLECLNDGRSAQVHAPINADETAFNSSGVEKAIIDLLDSISSERTLVILVDDSRAVDDISLALLKTLTQLAPSLALLLVLVCDASDTRTPLASLAASLLFLKPLGSDSSSKMLDALLASNSSNISRDARQWCIAIAGGNPQFLTLVADERSRHPALQDVPPSIVTAGDRRLSNLPSDATRVLEACVVLDAHCSVTTLEFVLGTTPFSLISALQELERSGLTQCIGEHILLRSTSFRDRVLAAVSKGVLAFLHSRTAQALENEHTNTVSPWTIATHWHNAGQPLRAHKILSSAWRRSIQLGQPRVAVESIREYLASHSDSATSVPIYDDLIEALQASGNARATIVAIDDRAALHTRCGVTDERSEEYSFDRIAAELQDHEDPSSSESALKVFMRSTTLNCGRRLQAARLLLANADASADLALAEEVIHSILSIELPHHERGEYDQALLIYHTVFGDKNEALVVAHRALFRMVPRTRRWLHITAQMNASLALRVADPSDAAVELLSACYENVRSIGATAWCIRAASRIANFALDNGDIALARRWLARATFHATDSDSGRYPVDYLSAQAEMAIIGAKFAEARKWIGAMRINSPVYRAPRFRMELLSYSLRLAQHENSPHDDAAIDELLDWHLRARSFARHDDAMNALWFGLTQQGRGALASDLLQEYVLDYRREASKPSHVLRSRSSGDPAWANINDTLGRASTGGLY